MTQTGSLVQVLRALSLTFLSLKWDERVAVNVQGSLISHRREGGGGGMRDLGCHGSGDR